MKDFNFFGVLIILTIWVGTVIITYFVRDSLTALINIILVYYLTKFVILRREK